METPVAPAHSKGSKPFLFDARWPHRRPQGQRIKIVSFANNHVMDQGWAGFAETRDHLRDQACSLPAPATPRPALAAGLHRANGIKVGWLA